MFLFRTGGCGCGWEGEPGKGWGHGVLEGGWDGRMHCSPSNEVEDSQLWGCSEIRWHQRILFMCSGTDVVENAICYGSTLLKDVREL